MSKFQFLNSLNTPNNRNYILWLGGIFNDNTILDNPAVSPAANKWQKEFILTLIHLGEKIVILGHLYSPIFPKGKLFLASSQSSLIPEFDGIIIDYCNLPFVKEQNTKISYLAAFQELCETHGKPKLIIGYNLFLCNVSIGNHARDALGIPVIYILADGFKSYLKKWQLSKLKNVKANGWILLSWSWFQDFDQEPKFHLDGGVNTLNLEYDNLDFSYDSSKKIFLYSGSISAHGGVDFLVDGFMRTQSKNIELWISGKGYSSKLNSVLQSEPRVKFWGLLPSEQFKKILFRANYFINPRPSNLGESYFNFPSKILDYLSYEKPVISTWTDGLAPSYRDKLIILEKETPHCLAETIENVANWEQSKILQMKLRIHDFLINDKLWTRQIEKCLYWINENILA